MTTRRLYLLFAHPAFHRSCVNRHLVDAVRDLPGVTIQDLYEVYPDFNIDVAAEQKALREHDILIFHRPFYWYSAPALLKEWQDLVLEYGFAYGDTGNALQGKQLLSVITTGGSSEAYHPDGINRYHLCQLLTPFEQTASFCGMTYLPPFVVHDALEKDETPFRQAAADYRTCLEGLRDGTLDLSHAARGTYLNDTLTRTAEDDNHAR